MKCVMIINHTLPVGLIANTAAVLAMSIGNRIESIIGDDVADADGIWHRGITRLGIPVLKGERNQIAALRDRLHGIDEPDVYYVDFCDVAQRSRDYGHYIDRMHKTPAKRLTYLGIAICGPEKTVNALTGNLPLLR